MDAQGCHEDSVHRTAQCRRSDASRMSSDIRALRHVLTICEGMQIGDALKQGAEEMQPQADAEDFSYNLRSAPPESPVYCTPSRNFLGRDSY